MGGSSWDDSHYKARAADRAARGVGAFDHSKRVMEKPSEERKVHPEMDPKGITMRESRDSDAHPNSKAIAIFFDVTASMASVPTECQKRLPGLQETFLSRGYCEDPQTLFGALTDCHNDSGYYGNKIPLQVGQFESGIEMDEDLGKVILEGGGGGTFEESYELALYMLARHTSIDCWEKRQEKGYAFLIGDEKSYEAVSPETAEQIFGDKLEAPVALDTLIKEVQEKYNLYFIIPQHTAHGTDPVLRDYWEQKLGQNVLMLPDASHICDLIGSTVGLMEGKVDADTIRSNSSVTGSLGNVAAAGANVRL